MKTFNELKVGDRIFDVTRLGKLVSIYEIRRIEKDNCGKWFYFSLIIGKSLSKIYIESGLHKTSYPSTRYTMVFANEEEFLDYINEDV